MDDWDKVPSFDAGEAPRRSTSSLGTHLVMAHGSTESALLSGMTINERLFALLRQWNSGYYGHEREKGSH